MTPLSCRRYAVGGDYDGDGGDGEVLNELATLSATLSARYPNNIENHLLLLEPEL